MNSPITFVDVILPLGVPNLFTYFVPEEITQPVDVGFRVVVQFGKSKLYSAVVAKIHEEAPVHYQPKPIQLILDEGPVVLPHQLDFWEWIRNYYMCHPGDVLSAALPGGLKISSETRLLLNIETEIDKEQLSDDGFLVVEALEINQVLTLDEVSKIINKKHIHKLISSLLNQGVIVVYEEIKEKFVPKKEKIVEITPQFQQEENLQMLFSGLERAPKQLAILLKYVEMGRLFSDAPSSVKQKNLLEAAQASSAQLKSLVEKGVFHIQEVVIGRLQDQSITSKKEMELSPAQLNSLGQIQEAFENKNVTLLHGVTSSGKTEVYVKLIEEYISQGKQVLYLLPEIALTTQIINRLRKYFGEKIGVYHSKFTQNERVEIWKKQLSSNGYEIILGARSSVFLPFQDLGLVIIDEEHDASFKQFEPAPRYNARDAAIVLAHTFKAKVLLGSATPALESMFNAQSGKYGYVDLTERFGGVQMPKIEIADLAEAHKKKKMQGHFSSHLIERIQQALDKKEQVILFQNRRGFSPYVICQTCGWTPYCKRCDVGLTYHKYLHRLKCHYCGFESQMPKKCEACGSHEVQLSGFGTEKIEEDISLMFPDAKIGRMDLLTQ